MSIFIPVVLSVYISICFVLFFNKDPRDRTPHWVILLWPMNLLWALLVGGIR